MFCVSGVRSVCLGSCRLLSCVQMSPYLYCCGGFLYQLNLKKAMITENTKIQENNMIIKEKQSRQPRLCHNRLKTNSPFLTWIPKSCAKEWKTRLLEKREDYLLFLMSLAFSSLVTGHGNKVGVTGKQREVTGNKVELAGNMVEVTGNKVGATVNTARYFPLVSICSTLYVVQVTNYDYHWLACYLQIINEF